MKSNLSLRTKLTGGFLAIGAITMLVGLLGWWGVARMQGLLTRTSDTQGVTAMILQREVDHLNWIRKVGQFQRDTNLVHIDVEKDPHKCGFGQWYYGTGRTEAEQLMPDLRPVLAQFEAPHQRLHKSAVDLEKLLAEGPASRQRAVTYYATETASALTELQQHFGELRPLITEHSNEARNLAATQGKTIKLTAAGAIVVSFGIALTFGLVFSGKIANPLKKIAAQMMDAVSETTAAAAQVSNASQSLAAGSSEQAASLEETSASLEEMASMTKRNAQGAAQAKDLAAQTRSAADTGATDMEEMNRAMDAIKGSSNDISKIIKTIDEIAFQTNILALNAAVEAARAGEAGAGFAVVADEVRNLAQRAAQSARETAAKIDDSVQKSAHGVQISGKVAHSLTEIVGKARQVDTLVAEIAQASNEQTQGIDQVNTAVSQMDKVTQSNAANAEETAAAAEELNAQSLMLRDAIDNLHKLIGGDVAGSPMTEPTNPPPVQSARLFVAPAHAAPISARSTNLPAAAVAGSHTEFKDV